MAVTSIEIKERGPYAGGMTFGETGAYEQLDGTVHFAVDPSKPANSLITDLELAPRNPAGLVEFSVLIQVKAHLARLKDKHGEDNFAEWWREFAGEDPPGDLEVDPETVI